MRKARATADLRTVHRRFASSAVSARTTLMAFGTVQMPAQRGELLVDLTLVLALELDEQRGVGARRQHGVYPGVVLAHEGEKAGVHDLHCGRIESEDARDRLPRGEHRREVGHGDPSPPRQGDEIEGGLGDQAQGALGADEQLLEVYEAITGHHLGRVAEDRLQPVARAVLHHPGHRAGYRSGVRPQLGDDLRERPAGEGVCGQEGGELGPVFRQSLRSEDAPVGKDGFQG